MGENITSLFLSTVDTKKDRIAFHYFEGEWKRMTFGEFFSRAMTLTSRLSDTGVKRGERVAVISENRPDWCAAYLAVLLNGCIAVPIDIQLGAEDARNIFKDADMKSVFCSAKMEAVAAEAVGKDRIKLINIDSVDFAGNDGISFDRSRLVVDAAPDDLASIIYTSGTTGNPKGVMLTHKNFCSDADAAISAGVVSPSDNVLSILPLHHTYPFMCNFMMAVGYGATVTFGHGLKGADIVDAVKTGGVTILLGVPRLFDMLRNGIMAKMAERPFAPVLFRLMNICGSIRRATGINLGKLVFGTIHANFRTVRFFCSGGARLEPASMLGLEALGFTVLEGYGLTETSPIITFNPITKRKPASVGRALSGAEIRIVDGEIVVRGPMVMAGYYKNPVATAEVIKEGWFHTGDLGRIDEEGYVFITGRKKEVIVLSSGKNIYPEDIEKAYYGIPLIKEIGIAGVEVRGAVDFIKAIVVPNLDYAKEHGIGDIHETIKWQINEVTSQLPEYMRIRGFILQQEPLPRTSLQKMRRFMLKDILSGAMSANKVNRLEDASLMADPVGRKIVDCICHVMNEKIMVHSEDNLELDLGFDSLRKIEFISALEEAFSVHLPDTFISDVQTVRDVSERIRDISEGRTHESAGSVKWADILEKEPAAEDKQKAVVVYGPFERLLIKPLFLILKIFCRLYFRMSVKGVENIPGTGPYIIAANHASYLDGFVVAASLPFSIFEHVYFLGISKFFGGAFKQQFARIGHIIPIDAETYLNRALQISSYVLSQGRSLCIFPEGGRSFGAEMLPFKKGVGIIAVEKDIPVVPVYIKGSAAAFPRGSALIRPARIAITIGRSYLASGADFESRPSGIDKYQFFADELREQVKRLQA
jgi:long-chain acyl-CoA synthetase